MGTMSKEFFQKSKKDIWQTPTEITQPLNETIGIDLDPCAGPDTQIADTNWSIEYGKDGLKSNWFGNVFINPPFSNKTEFIKKSVEEKDNTDITVLLTPDSTDVKSWYHNLICNHYKYTWFSKGRINYIDPKTGKQEKGVSFGTALHFMGGMDPSLELWLRENGDLVSRKI